MQVNIGDKAPNIGVSEWIQGYPTNVDKNFGKIILIEVFQVNCPGCFLYGIPESISVYNSFKRDDVVVWGLATAFEDYDKNTIDNLKLLLTEGEVIGETYNALKQQGQLNGSDKLHYKIPFPVAMDNLKTSDILLTENKIYDFIHENIPDFNNYSINDQTTIKHRIVTYLKNKKFSAETFERYSLQGTPSSIIIDKKGILRYKLFGYSGSLSSIILGLLND